ncbi:putative ENT domain, Agenet-like domain, Agenet domain, plant type [Lupinus albus]|uniref:Putative ENT domain, Agenet-like domain, Agenet domain, plant type n=1 Tax=Lupinus albus TaxID=3870 RepID=A0A6A4Q8L8_LUPAL|nr:putative ENT domain, Agenet-like domain, Agenet domain, plant type [Lupinus albus]
MRFKEGAKVEVLCNTEVPSGSWLCADIICDSGHYCTIRYDGYHDADGEAIVEQISRKAIRPCPPAIELVESWCPGDIVEIFQNFSWKMATVLKALGKKYILVRLLGSSLEFQVSKFDIRVRQSWQNGKWIVVGEGSASYENEKRDKALNFRQNLFTSAQIQKSATKTKLSASNVYNPQSKKPTMLESRLVSFKTLKRGSHSQVDAYAEPPPKFRAFENEGRCHRAMVRNLPIPFKQVHGVSFPRVVLVDECIPASVNNRKAGMSYMDMEGRKQTGVVRCSFGENLESNDADSVTCSVGSCSITSRSSYKLQSPESAGPFEDVDGSFSDAESYCQRGYEEGSCSPPTQQELAAEIHKIELHAYRCTIEALHASGPLSWEQEVLMTNLRLSLHISNDEHLMELRNLISSENSIPFR